MSIVFHPFGEFMASCYIPEKNNNSNIKYMRIVFYVCCFVWPQEINTQVFHIPPQNFFQLRYFQIPQSISSLLCMHGWVNAFRWTSLFYFTQTDIGTNLLFFFNNCWGDMLFKLLPFLAKRLISISSNSIPQCWFKKYSEISSLYLTITR